MNEISLYIHIPFCKSKCNYCDFFSKSIDCSFNFFQDEYVNALCNEISFYFYNSNCKLKSVYIGGGTPSLISILNLKKIISCVESNLKNKSKDFELTIELNPDDINYELITFLNESIVNRVSLGVQSLNEQTLKPGLLPGRHGSRSSCPHIPHLRRCRLPGGIIPAWPHWPCL